MTFSEMKRLLSALFLCLLFFPTLLCHANTQPVSEKQEIFFEKFDEENIYHYKDGDEWAGFEVELIASIFDDEHYEVRYITAHEAKKRNIFLLRFSLEELSDNELFIETQPIYVRKYAPFTLTEQHILNLNEEKLGSLKAETKPGALPEDKMARYHLAPGANQATLNGIRALLDNKIDVWFDDVHVVNYILIKNNLKSKIEYHHDMIYNAPVRIILPKEQETLLQAINARIEEMQESGEFENIHLKYFQTHSEEYLTSEKNLTNLRVAGGIVLFFVVVLLLSSNKIIEIFRRRKYLNTVARCILRYGNRFIMIWQTRSSHIETNVHFKDIFGAEAEKVSTKIAANFRRSLQDVADGDSPDTYEKNLNGDAAKTAFKDSCGEMREISWTSIFINGRRKRKTFLSIGSDMTEKNRLRRELKLSEERYLLAMKSADIAIIFITRYGKISYISDLGHRLLGYSQSDSINVKTLMNRIHPEDQQEFSSKILDNGLCLDQLSSCEVRVLSAENEYRWFAFKFKRIENPASGEPYMAGAFYDVHTVKEKDLRIEKLAYEDVLTGIYNRRRFLSLLKKHLVGTAKYTVISINLNNFHRFNDRFGVENGDRILKEFANILKRNPYSKEYICSRLGNDEFALLIRPDENSEPIEAYLQRILDEIQQFTMTYYDGMKLTFSAGSCTYPNDMDNYKDVFENSVFSMRIAHSDSNNFYQPYNSEINDLILKRNILEKEIKEAIEKKQFIPFYQPKMDIATQKMVGVEALIRWEHPEKGIVYPNDFIQTAEEMGIIGEIGKLILERACLDSMEWQASGYPQIKVSVNISPVEFYQSDIVQLTKTYLSQTGLAPEGLELELTESMAMQDVAETRKKMLALKELGVGISLDDFGTGHSSLSCIQNLPLDELKLDKSFIDKITFDETTRNIVSTVIRLAKIIGLVVVAEGVETWEQFELLKEMDCNIAQGYLFSKPVPKEELIKMM